MRSLKLGFDNGPQERKATIMGTGADERGASAQSTPASAAGAHSKARKGIACTLALCCAFLPTAALAGCDSNQQEDSEQTASQDTEQEQASFIAHGSEYSKSETVAATSTLNGTVTEIAVDEWIKNPKGKESIEDESSLQQVTSDDDGVSFTQDGEKLTWTTGGADVNYSGITDKELPFSIKYSYKLDGKKIEPAQLKNVTGKLKITIKYEVNQDLDITVNDQKKTVKQPYLMASMVSFDSEHAKNVTVTQGSAIDQSGSIMAAGIAMPGLAKTLELDDKVQLPEGVTIKADVKGFDMPNITTMATNQALSIVNQMDSDDVDSTIDGIFDQVDSIQTALSSLSQGTSAINTALGKISAGQSKLNSAFPSATGGLSKIGEGAAGIGKLNNAAGESLKTLQNSQASMAAQLKALKEIDTGDLTSSAKKQLESSITTLEAELAKEQQLAAAVAGMTSKAGTAATSLAQGLGKVSSGLGQIQKGYTQLGSALKQVESASGKLSQGTETMASKVKEAIGNLRGGIDDKLDLITAIADAVEAGGAYYGSSSEMSASTMFTVTAKVEG